MNKSEKKVLLGTANFSRSYRLSEPDNFSPQDVLTTAFENGINCLDVSDSYEGAYSEIKKSGFAWSLNSKLVLNLTSRNYQQEISSQVTKILEAVPKAQITSLLIHNGSKLSQSCLEDAIDSLRIVGERFGISNVGVSLYPDDNSKMKIEGLNTIQIPINILDQRVLSTPFDADKISKIRYFQARSIFLRGLLSSPDILHSLASKLELTEVTLFHSWCIENEIDPIFACINFIYHTDSINSIVMGVHSRKEFLRNLKALEDSKAHKLGINFEAFQSTNLELIDPRRWRV